MSVPVTVIAAMDTEKQNTAVVETRTLSLADRLWRSAKVLGTCWGIGILCILVPVFHFVLVPAFLLIGIGMFYRQMLFHEVLISGQICCPKCQKEFAATANAFNWPKRETCAACDAALILNPKES
jgi:hypothetical protein